MSHAEEQMVKTGGVACDGHCPLGPGFRPGDEKYSRNHFQSAQARPLRKPLCAVCFDELKVLVTTWSPNVVLA